MHEARKILSKLFLLPFRKIQFSSKLHHDKCNEKLVKNLKNKIGPDAVLVIGPHQIWSFMSPLTTKAYCEH